jgi:hypothetical protein
MTIPIAKMVVLLACNAQCTPAERDFGQLTVSYNEWALID